MAGTIRPNEINVSTTPVLASKTLPGLPDLLKIESKKPSVPRAPRVDVEPLYTSIKSGISDSDWTTYKTSLTSFLLGNLNQEELTQRLDRVLVTRELEHAHNAFMMGIYMNMWRDAPEAGIASWVSSSDKPSGGVVKGTGDESEKRLKHEVMQLARRERKRLKTTAQDGRGVEGAWPEGVGGVMAEYHDARKAKLPEAGPASSGAGFQKTNWDLEIRKRYTSSLFTETHEFPTANTISHRLLPICYEFGLPQGHTNDCAELMNIATETYIKEALMNFFQVVSSNGPGFVRTSEYKKKVEREERAVERGELQRAIGGELPVEAEERRKRKLLCMEDLRIALDLGDGYLGQIPLLSGSITNSRLLDTPGMEEIYDTKPSKSLVNGLTNGVNGTAVSTNTVNGGWNVDLGDPMVLDEELTWQGGSVKDLDDLDGALDAVLDLADL